MEIVKKKIDIRAIPACLVHGKLEDMQKTVQLNKAFFLFTWVYQVGLDQWSQFAYHVIIVIKALFTN